MEEKKQLSIGLVEESLGWQVILQEFLTLAGHAVSICRERGEQLCTWLSPCTAPFGPSGLLPYDLLINT